MAADMVEYGSPFQEQSLLRTVSLSFRPYLPFTQSYEMTLDNIMEEAGGAGRYGYFMLGPEDKPGAGDTRDGYEWTERRRVYAAQGTGRLAPMSTMVNREQQALTAATDMGEVPLAAEDLAVDLSSMLDIQGSKYQGWASSLSSYHRGELETQLIDTIYGQWATGDTGGAPQKRLKHEEGASTQTFDYFLEDFDSYARYVENVMKNSDLRNIKHMEAHHGRGGPGAAKSLSRISDNYTTEKGALTKWRGKIDSQIVRFNLKIKKAVEAAQEKGTFQGGYLGARALFPGGYGVVRKTGPQSKATLMDFEIRQFLDRARYEQRTMAANKTKGVAKWIYQVNLPKNMIGYTLIGATMNDAGIPKLKNYAKDTYVIKSPDGTESFAYVSYLQRVEGLDTQLAATILTKAKEYSVNTAISKKKRIELIGVTAMGTADIEAASQITLKAEAAPLQRGSSRIILTPTEIAQKLSANVFEFFNNTQNKTNFANFYQRLLEESNSLTELWKKDVGVGPVYGHSIWEEFIFGDNEGNPRKRFLGLWSDFYGNWKDSATGYNFAIAPQLVARRAGVSAFGQ